MEKKWWREGIIYQIYPQSFYDSDHDGIGDLKGIIQKLDYIAALGVDIIWLNPIYDSPMHDNGYDISDFRKINPMYGSMDDFDLLLDGIHQRGMKLIMDIVVNHTSDQHPWFKASRSSVDHPKRDYYFWKKGKEGRPPNNWPSIFGGSAWEKDEITGEYYLHYFTKNQPDLNWENAQLREEIYAILTWWLDKGIDGFRLDVIPMISKRIEFPDAPMDKLSVIIEQYYSNGPKVHEYIHSIHERVFKNYDVMTVGEGPGITPESGNLYTGSQRGELNMIFPLDLMFADWIADHKFETRPMVPADIKNYFTSWNKGLGNDGWISVFLDNHDFPRMVSRFGDDQQFRLESTKLLCMLLMTLKGTPSIYYGSEIGMTNAYFTALEDYRDIETFTYFEDASQKGLDQETIMQQLMLTGRDNARTPMQWNGSAHGGFTTAKPWIKVNDNYKEINVSSSLADPDSLISFYKKIIFWRKEHPEIVYGDFTVLSGDHPAIYHYMRRWEDKIIEVVLNLSGDEIEYPYGPERKNPDRIISNYGEKHKKYRPWEGCIWSNS